MSLKTLVIPGLANALAVTPAALYERQRVLLRAGLLHAEPGRGPGSGVHATPESVAMMLISLLATDSVSEAGSQTEIFASLKSEAKQHRCPLTGQETFVSAVAAVLASEDTARRVRWIEVDRGKMHAFITYKPRGSEFLTSLALDLLSECLNPVVSGFGFEGRRPRSALSIRAKLEGEVRGARLDFAALAHALKEAKK